MLDMLNQRLEELKQKFTTAQENIKTLNAQLENEKSVALQLMGHFNEANHILEEAKKITNNQEELNGEAVQEECNQIQLAEQGE